MEATLNVMLLTLTTAVFCDNDMYVVTLTRSMVLECVNFKGLQDSLRFPVLLANCPPEPNWSPRMLEIEARTHQTAPYWGNAASKCYLRASDTLLTAAWTKVIAKTRTTTPPVCKKSNMQLITHLTLGAARVPQTHTSDWIKWFDYKKFKCSVKNSKQLKLQPMLKLPHYRCLSDSTAVYCSTISAII